MNKELKTFKDESMTFVSVSISGSLPSQFSIRTGEGGKKKKGRLE